jgi:hypothetical protein
VDIEASHALNNIYLNCFTVKKRDKRKGKISKEGKIERTGKKGGRRDKGIL